MCPWNRWSSSLRGSLPSRSFSAGDRLLLVSDLHLADETPSLTELALGWLEQATQAHGITHLWILGDLFDAWVGDDQLGCSPAAQQASGCLRALAGRGLTLGLMQGNRDFLLGEDFAHACSAELLAESWSGALPDQRIALICHGDSLCLDDLDYMRFRAQTRAPAWQQDFLAQPLAQRLATARQMRTQSETHKAGKSPEIMDIRPSAAEALLRERHSRLLIHGHTHRPGESRLGETSCRWVLTDWHWGPRQSDCRGGGLLLTAAGIQSLGLSDV